MPTDRQANLVDHVLFATHDYPCPLRGCGNKAILMMHTGIFGPCVEHTSLVTPPQKIKVPWYRKIFNSFIQ